MGAWVALGAVVVLCLASTPFGTALPLSVSATHGGWESFRLQTVGTNVTFVVEARPSDAATFGADLYSAGDVFLGSLRVSLNGPGERVDGEVLEHEFDLTFARNTPYVQVGGTSSVLAAVNAGLACSGGSMRFFFSGRYEVELHGCAGLAAAKKALLFGVASGTQPANWRLELAPGSTLSPVERSAEVIYLGMDDFDGTALHLDGPVDVVHAPARTATVPVTHGFLGAFAYVEGLQSNVDHSYASPTAEHGCGCFGISEPGVPGPRTFRMDGTSVSDGAFFVLAGVDARLPP